MAEKCSKCAVEILWLTHIATRRASPIEATPSANGNLVIDRNRALYRLASQAEIKWAKAESKNLYINHFATCKFAKSFRKQPV